MSVQTRVRVFVVVLIRVTARQVYYHRIMFLPKRSSSIPQQVEVHGKVPKPGTIDYQYVVQ